MCNNVWYFTFMKIKIYELTCKRRLQWKKLIEILSEVTICQSHHFLKISGFIPQVRLKKCWWHARLRKISDLRKNLQMSLSLRKHSFGGTVWWEKLKFSEKSQIWENLSVGGPEAWCSIQMTTNYLSVIFYYGN